MKALAKRRGLLYLLKLMSLFSVKQKQLDDFIKLSIDQAVPTGLGFATRDYLGA